MKVGIVTEYFYPTLGGISENIYHFSKELLRRGHDFRIITGFMGDPSDIDREVGSRMIFLGRSINVFFNGSCGRISVGANLTRKMKEVLSEEKFDIVHTHSPLFPTLPPIANMQASVPVVGTFHTCTSGDLLYYKIYRKTAQRQLDRMEGKIAVSECCALENRNYFNANFEIIPNGVDISWWENGTRRIPKFDDDTTNILFLGRPDRRNGLDTLILAFAKIHRAEPNTRLIIVGDGPLRFHFEELIPDEIRKAVFFEGAAGANRPNYMATADVFCFTPTIASFGVTILEGMSAAKAMVASDIEAFRALVKDEESALLVKPGDINEHAHAILTLIRDPLLRKKLGANARAAVAKYDWTRVADSQIDYYRKILGDKVSK